MESLVVLRSRARQCVHFFARHEWVKIKDNNCSHEAIKCIVFFVRDFLWVLLLLLSFTFVLLTENISRAHKIQFPFFLRALFSLPLVSFFLYSQRRTQWMCKNGKPHASNSYARRKTKTKCLSFFYISRRIVAKNGAVWTQRKCEKAKLKWATVNIWESSDDHMAAKR